MIKTSEKKGLRRLLRDEAGNFAIMTALALPVVLAAGGVAMDLANLAQKKALLQDAADSAALAAASALTTKGATHEQAKEVAKDFLAGQITGTLEANETEADRAAREQKFREGASVNVTETPFGKTGKKYDVQVSVKLDVPYNSLTQLLLTTFGGESADSSTGDASARSAGVSTAAAGQVGVASGAESSTETKNPISMYLVLDRSGSMSFVTEKLNPDKNKCDNYNSAKWPDPYSTSPCYTRKIEALQTAAKSLFTMLDEKNEENSLIRVGAVSYTDSTQTAKAVNWGTTDARSYVANLPYKPTGGTNATGAMKAANKALTVKEDGSDTETKAHKAKDNAKFSRYIVLMTDGEMTGNSSKWNASIDDDVRDECEAAKANGIQIFSVAFMAPDKGKSLLQYCASSGNYYAPDTMDDLVDTFGDIAAKATEGIARLTN
ncbi:VWA domain-containing protein [Rhizobiaceae bacterium n13]|uniref:VWA domain-containing protein n=2 Tax=Ferirhizobium litorale TaxID=2927786 RepID=A0AAE3U251_9HYPH|nr:TadE/TadG family type IV pilus assembly protein [Fererhizobium litorale]MDI7860489.1 VWA domain-containing protein [Fererhizobium litorale]MDI7920624.1 VWA domain-containing protein [Fererhizobium litorale]